MWVLPLGPGTGVGAEQGPTKRPHWRDQRQNPDQTSTVCSLSHWLRGPITTLGERKWDFIQSPSKYNLCGSVYLWIELIISNRSCCHLHKGPSSRASPGVIIHLSPMRTRGVPLKMDILAKLRLQTSPAPGHTHVGC